jgi:hypothetical protein
VFYTQKKVITDKALDGNGLTDLPHLDSRSTGGTATRKA